MNTLVIHVENNTTCAARISECYCQYTEDFVELNYEYKQY